MLIFFFFFFNDYSNNNKQKSTILIYLMYVYINRQSEFFISKECKGYQKYVIFDKFSEF